MKVGRHLAYFIYVAETIQSFKSLEYLQMNIEFQLHLGGGGHEGRNLKDVTVEAAIARVHVPKCCPHS
jgi:hypothetical protein